MCNFELYECGSIYIFVISMYIYAVRCLYVEFRFICVRFDNFVRNGTSYLSTFFYGRVRRRVLLNRVTQ